jgi:N-acetylglucosamine-6-phosphate deacetylase
MPNINYQDSKPYFIIKNATLPSGGPSGGSGNGANSGYAEHAQGAQGAHSTQTATNHSSVNAANVFLLAKEGKVLECGELGGDTTLESVFEKFSIDLDNAEIIDAKGDYITPGLIDIHTHGGAGANYDDQTENPNAIQTAQKAHAEHGTAYSLISLVTNPIDVMVENIKAVVAECKANKHLLGLHLEGPFIALNRKGAHNPDFLREPDLKAIDTLLEAGDGWIKQITIAPELPGGLDAVAHIAKNGVIPAVGHTDCDYNTAKKAFDMGAGLLTHTFNTMNEILHRAPGPIVAALESKGVYLELINDGVHVSTHVAELLAREALDSAKAGLAGGMVLITDSMSATTLSDGAYMLGTLGVEVKDSVARLTSNGAIAGSTLTMDKAVQNFACPPQTMHGADSGAGAVGGAGGAASEPGAAGGAASGAGRGTCKWDASYGRISVKYAVDAATITPAKAIGEADNVGSLTAKKASDCLLWDKNWNLKAVYLT